MSFSLRLTSQISHDLTFGVAFKGNFSRFERLDPVLTYEFHEGLASFNSASFTFRKCSCVVKNLRYIFE